MKRELFALIAFWLLYSLFCQLWDITLGQKSIFHPKNRKFEISRNSHFQIIYFNKKNSQKSHFQNIIFHKIHISEAQFVTKIAFSKSHFSQKSHYVFETSK